ncbi:Lrp/AsnC ligand binding domain-containing protein [Porticoccaceae bacterium LTM1]|nr:Lrp/AsnC ligand binding domain-containing protein [Porticoccaceae bacterium LTM1]
MSKKNKPLDRVDLQILAILQKNSKISNVELAERVHLTPPPCLERVKRLERDGYIQRYTCILDPYKLRTGLLAFIQVSLRSTASRELDEFNRAISQLEEVQECHMVSGGFDYLLKVRTSDMQTYRRFLGEELANIPNVRETHTYVAMQEVKSDTALPLQFYDHDQL